jgi:hypothetical protein
LEHEIIGETVGVAFDCFIEALCGYAVEAGEVGGDDDALASDDKDALLDVVNGNDGAGGFSGGHRTNFLTSDSGRWSQIVTTYEGRIK